MENLIIAELKKHNIQADVRILASCIEFTIVKHEDAVKLQKAFIASGIKEVNLFHLSEVEEVGFMVEIRL